MRLSIFFVVAFVANVLGQSTTEPDVFVTTIEPAPEPTAEPAPPPTSETPILTTPPATEISTTETTTPPPVSTSAPPSAGGATCVQRCLAQSASIVGCASNVDWACVCNSQTYLSIARTCFTDSACNADASQMAVQDYGTVCSATTTPADTSVSTRSTQPTSRTRTNTGSLASPTTKTLVFTSGAVVSISGGVSSTITSGFTSIRTGQAGDFATDSGLGPTAGIDGGPLNNGAPGVNVGHLASFGMMMGLGVAGGIVVLAL